MKKVMTIFWATLLVPIILTSCDGGHYPSDQEQFINQIKLFQKNYTDSEGNDVAQNDACNNLDNFVRGKSFSNWNGNVEEVASILGSRWIVVKAGGLIFKLWPENDENWSKIGESMLSNLRKGDKIVFSGTVTREMSITCSGKMREPEIQIEPSSVSKQ